MNLYQRKNAVMKAIKYLKKDGRISFGNQSYMAITHDAVIGALRPHLVKEGIDIGVSVTGHELVGKTTIADVDLILTNIEKPEEQIIYHGFAYGDNGDKGPGSAISYAVKNLLLKAFAIETGENDESRFEIDTTPQDVVDKLNKAADGGTEAFREAWREVPEKTRQGISADRIDGWKTKAHEADKEAV